MLLRNNGLVKTVKFKESTYIGDPINTVKIFNEKEVDEIFFLDIDATRLKKEPPYDLIQNIASECFMPFAYGGGIHSLQQIERIIKSGAEKIIINTQAFLGKNFLKEAVNQFGSSTIAVSIDVKKEFLKGNIVYVKGGTQSTGINPVDYAKEIENAGAGEILINSIDRDGVMGGYDIELIKSISGINQDSGNRLRRSWQAERFQPGSKTGWSFSSCRRKFFYFSWQKTCCIDNLSFLFRNFKPV